MQKKTLQEDFSKKTAEFNEQKKKDSDQINSLNKRIKELEIKQRQLEKAVDDREGSAQLQLQIDQISKESAQKLKALEVSSNKKIEDLTKQINILQDKASKEGSQYTDQITTLTAGLAASELEKKNWTDKYKQLENDTKDFSVLQEKANQLDTVIQEKLMLVKDVEDIERKYKTEMKLRVKYFNELEDMKGKIRVYVRCRPFAEYEREKGNVQCVRFPDDTTVEVDVLKGGKKESRQFTFDRMYDQRSTQEQIFEDTNNLLQSAFDGFNVCIFAYGQTGSGKTFTMTGTESLPGITRRSISRLYEIIDENKEEYITTVKSYMVEIYRDEIMDLFFRLQNKKNAVAPKLKIVKESNGLVSLKESVVVDILNPNHCLELFINGNNKRHTGATAMNAESSRSHLIFSLILTVTNRRTNAVKNGKISFIDLAGSERAGKTGATDERLKEAMAINKSLSALGNVISALSENSKNVPYRENVLTMLMQDSLGGNAKTLMFVNISPSDYNSDETHQSLQYASRVKLITNNPTKDLETAEILRLKKIIGDLKAGKAVTEPLEEILEEKEDRGETVEE